MNAIAKAINHAGGPAKFARALGVTIQAACFWRDGKRTFPAEHCPTAEKLSARAVTCEELRPDVDWAYVRGTAHTDPTLETQLTEAAKAGQTERRTAKQERREVNRVKDAKLAAFEATGQGQEV